MLLSIANIKEIKKKKNTKDPFHQALLQPDRTSYLMFKLNSTRKTNTDTGS